MLSINTKLTRDQKYHKKKERRKESDNDKYKERKEH